MSPVAPQKAVQRPSPEKGEKGARPPIRPFLLTQANRLPPRFNRRPEGRLDHCRGLDLMPLWGAREAS